MMQQRCILELRKPNCYNIIIGKPNWIITEKVKIRKKGENIDEISKFRRSER